MAQPPIGLLDPTRILFDLQQANEIAQDFSGCLEPEEIARCVTQGLVEKFDCVFVRLWLLDADQTTLELVASAGLYTNTNGFFARVPMGAYKVGKIAQNRIAFLSNNLAAEPWVGNREWAIANRIHGFAGYPLAIKDRVIGVLATFSHSGMEPEFLEVLQTLCNLVTIALDTALQYQKDKQLWQSTTPTLLFSHLSLSEQIASILCSTRLMLVGTEQSLSLPITYVFLRAAEIFNAIECTYCRLIYTDAAVALEAMIPTAQISSPDPAGWINASLQELSLMFAHLGGALQTQVSLNQRSVQVVLNLPYRHNPTGQLQICCRLPVLQLAFTQLAVLAGLKVCLNTDTAYAASPLLTDDVGQIRSAKPVLWIQQGNQAVPKGIQAKIDLSTSPEQLRQAVEAVSQGKLWGIDAATETQPTLSERELEILTLLTQGHRDRDIADRLIISESTVKFHMNNVLAKLKVRTRYQAIYQAIVQGWV